MLSIFPSLLSYGILAPLVLRVLVGLIFIDLAYLKLHSEKKAWNLFFDTIRLKPGHLYTKIFAALEIIGGVLLIIGLYTQLVALVFALITFAECYIEMQDNEFLKRDIVFYVLILAICLSLLVLGAGAFALDLPL